MFMIAKEALSRLIMKASDCGFILAVLVKGRGGGEEEISHVLCANDAIICCEVS